MEPLHHHEWRLTSCRVFCLVVTELHQPQAFNLLSLVRAHIIPQILAQHRIHPFGLAIG